MLADQLYVADRALALSIYLALELRRPLFLEGEAGVGKTEVAKALSAGLGTELIRLQCYEGLDVAHALYEWNYARQLLEIRLLEASHELERTRVTEQLFSERFLIRRPLLRALSHEPGAVPVLLIDEIDRADEEFEGFLLELLSDYQVTIPELGTIGAAEPPIVILTSNRTREVRDALKRRCLYYSIDYPSFKRVLGSSKRGCLKRPADLAEQVTAFVQELRGADLHKMAGISETLDWIAALVALDRGRTRRGRRRTDAGRAAWQEDHEDIESIRGSRLRTIMGEAKARVAALNP